MLDRRWRPAAPLLLASAAVAAACASLAGCGQAAAHPAAAGTAPRVSGTPRSGTPRSGTPGSGTPRSGTPRSGTPSAGPFSAAKLRGALLARINGVPMAAPAAGGDYAPLPNGSAGLGGSAGQPPVNAIRVIPADCGGATMTGFNPAALAGLPAAAATFKVGRNGVSEMLVSSPVKVASAALAGRLPAACAHYREIVDGRIFRYTARESAVRGVGQQALVLNVRPAGTSVDNLWSIVYRGAGFVGSVTVVGPDATDAAVRQLGQQAYAFAAQSLS